MDRKIRIFAVITLVISIVTMTLMGGGMRMLYTGKQVVFIRPVIIPVLVGAFLYGIRGGAALGLFTGGVILLHASLLPVDGVEYSYGGSFSILIIMTAAGVLFGVLAGILKKHCKRRILRWGLSLGAAFLLSFLADGCTLVIGNLYWFSEPMKALMVLLLNDLIGLVLQALLECIVAAVICMAADAFIDRETTRGISLRGTFQLCLLLVVYNVFAIVSSVEYICITNETLKKEKAEMEAAIIRYGQFLTEYGMDLETFEKAFDQEHYGTIAVFEDGYFVMMNDPEPDVRTSINDFFGNPEGKAAQDYFSYLCEKETLSSDYVYFDDGSTAYMYMLLRHAGKYDIQVMKSEEMIFASLHAIMRWSMLTTLLILSAVYALIYLLIDRLIVRRIEKTNAHLSKITSGDLEERVEEEGTREFRSLARGINVTVGTLEQSMQDIEARIAEELATAQRIQESALPRVFPPFPEVKQLELFASMDPAKEVGGDLYDFFRIGEEKIGLVLGDVAGKGIPASLFMMAAKTELEACMESGMDLAEAIARANQKLCEGNEAEMFVTVFAAIFDHRTGVMEYVNAGHNPPLLRHDGTWTYVRPEGRASLFLGMFPTAKYKTQTMTLAEGDAFFIYSDGVTEALNTAEVLYGEPRLQEFLNTHTDVDMETLTKAVRRDIDLFADGAERSDDITMLAFSFGT